MLEDIIELIKTCLPIIVGGLIVIVPTIVEKSAERKNQDNTRRHKDKQEIYVELITLFGKVLKDPDKFDLDLLINRVNLISITGNAEVVKALNDYLDTWSKKDVNVQYEKYNELLKVIRVDLDVDKKKNEEFPKIGLRDINIRHTRLGNTLATEKLIAHN